MTRFLKSMLLCSSLLLSGAATNMVQNPGMELLSKNEATGWYGSNKGVWGNTLFVDKYIFHGGTTSVRLEAKAPYVTLNSNPITVISGNEYLISFWRKQDCKASTSSTYLNLVQNAGKSATQWVQPSVQRGSHEWLRYSLIYLAPAEVRQVQLAFSLDTKTDDGSRAWIDDVEVVPADRESALRLLGPEAPRDQCPLSHGRWTFLPDISDEFDGEKIDPSRWEVRDHTKWGGPFEMLAENVSVSQGRLIIGVTKTQSPPDPSIRFNSGMIVSRRKFQYGYVEIKAKLTRCAARNAFWLLGNEKGSNTGWSEIDGFESWGGPLEGAGNRINFTLHHKFLFDQAMVDSETRQWKAPVRLDEGTHRYGLEWNRDHVVLYFDGTPVLVHENPGFHSPLAVVLNVEPANPSPEAGELPDAMRVEYVRVWVHGGAVGVIAPQQCASKFSFGFSRPPEGGSSQTIRLKAVDSGWMTLTREADGDLLLAFDDPSYFKTHREAVLEREIPLKCEDGTTLRFQCRFANQQYTGWQTSNGYRLISLELALEASPEKAGHKQLKGANGEVVTLDWTR